MRCSSQTPDQKDARGNGFSCDTKYEFKKNLYQIYINPVKPSDNCLFHLLQQSVTLHSVFVCFL
jgi:hypothetical protein